jgi:threonine dehydrogenase-like Zn-dependent dehydrogenase
MCDYCLKGHPFFCKIEGKNATIGIRRNGGWAQFCRLSAKNVIPLPHQVTFEQALFTEPLSCVLNGWQSLGPVKADIEILICGTGNSGLLWASFLHFRGYREVVMSEVLKGRQRIAQQLNFGYQVVNPDILISEARNAKNEQDEEWGFDIVIDSTGDPKCFEQSLKWLRRGGKLLLLGACLPSSEVTLNPHEIYKKELKILASSSNPFTFTPAIQVIKDMGERYLGFEQLGVRTFQLQEYLAAVETMRSGEISKAVFEY